jgi:hypothetical protein
VSAAACAASWLMVELAMPQKGAGGERAAFRDVCDAGSSLRCRVVELPRGSTMIRLGAGVPGVCGNWQHSRGRQEGARDAGDGRSRKKCDGDGPVERAVGEVYRRSRR